MSQQKLFIQLTKSLTDAEFDRIAHLYLSEVEGLNDIINCNGPYDGGLDMRNANISKIESQYQITTKEKGFELKLEEDLQKAAKNTTNFNLPLKVKYFYSYPLS